MKFIVGIGNPGRDYEKTRHNVGFRLIEALKKETLPKGTRLVKPGTYVNRTGEEIFGLVKRYKASLEDILIVSDDVNLPVGKMRLRPAGSSGGHKGLQSVIEALGTQDFARLRIGVGGSENPKALADFVLGFFSQEEEKELAQVLKKAVKICGAWAKEGFQTAQDELSKISKKE